MLNWIKAQVKKVVDFFTNRAKAATTGVTGTDVVLAGVAASVLFIPAVTAMVGSVIGSLWASGLLIVAVAIYFLCWFAIAGLLWKMIFNTLTVK